MCVIVDADKTGELLKNPSPAESRPLLQWLMKGGVMVYSTGGVFARQFPQANIDQLVKLFQNLQLRAIPPEKVENKMRDLPKNSAPTGKKVPVTATFSRWPWPAAPKFFTPATKT